MSYNGSITVHYLFDFNSSENVLNGGRQQAVGMDVDGGGTGVLVATGVK